MIKFFKKLFGAQDVDYKDRIERAKIVFDDNELTSLQKNLLMCLYTCDNPNTTLYLSAHKFKISEPTMKSFMHKAYELGYVGYYNASDHIVVDGRSYRLYIVELQEILKNEDK